MPMIKVLKYEDADFDQQLRNTLAFEESSASAIELVVDDILQQVRKHGDAALISLTNKFDKTQAASIEDLTVDEEVLRSALSSVDSEVVKALRNASDRIESYHQRQVQSCLLYTSPSPRDRG